MVPWTYQFIKAGWLAMCPRDLFVSASPVLGLFSRHATTPDTFTWLLGLELMTLYLQGKHFSHSCLHSLLVFETGPHCAAQDGLQWVLGLQVHSTKLSCSRVISHSTPVAACNLNTNSHTIVTVTFSKELGTCPKSHMVRAELSLCGASLR